MATKNGSQSKSGGVTGGLTKRLLSMGNVKRSPQIGKSRARKRQEKLHPLLRGAEARGVRGRGRDIYTGSVPMFSLGGKLLDGEGATEIDFWTVVDFAEEGLLEADAQWHPIQFELYDRVRFWIPDGRLVRRDRARPTLIEIKPLSSVRIDPVEDPIGAKVVKDWMAALTSAADREGADFELITDFEVRTEPRFWNAQMMHRALGTRFSDKFIDAVVDELPRLPAASTVSELADLIPDIGPAALSICCCLDRKGHIRLDRSTPFRPASMFANYRTAGQRSAIVEGDHP
ncbi:hypothetical protein VW35_15255 [Devosia soli]|uniref:TnsA endonuclease N-terminal domain-containing protein n=1 Tax=Devosia soli TaxID=361041 RepID=A0A0F5L5J9_9HYPH|nr:hypothetical protein [Devosia soli]KKB77494.1 hypothetical protein VW35_15255 [Devosia soli]